MSAHVSSAYLPRVPCLIYRIHSQKNVIKCFSAFSEYMSAYNYYEPEGQLGAAQPEMKWEEEENDEEEEDEEEEEDDEGDGGVSEDDDGDD